MVQLQQLGFVLALCCRVGFTSAAQKCVNQASCTSVDGAEVDAVSLMQTGRWVLAKHGKAAPVSDDPELLQTKVTVQKPRTTLSGDGQDEKAPQALLRKYAAHIIDTKGNESTVLLQALSAQQHGLSNDCTPQCTWKCQSQVCDQVCKPTCQAPVCETRCLGMDTSMCSLECDKPECAVVCPPNQCTNGCAECQTQCSQPHCKLNCPNAQPCRNVCEEPRCEFHCSAPKSCPEPKCQLQCERPTACMKKYNTAPLPPLENGEVSIKSFSGGAQIAERSAPVVKPVVSAPDYVPVTAPCNDNYVSPVTVTSMEYVGTPCNSAPVYTNSYAGPNDWYYTASNGGYTAPGQYIVPAPAPAPKSSGKSDKAPAAKGKDKGTSLTEAPASDTSAPELLEAQSAKATATAAPAASTASAKPVAAVPTAATAPTAAATEVPAASTASAKPVATVATAATAPTAAATEVPAASTASAKPVAAVATAATAPIAAATAAATSADSSAPADATLPATFESAATSLKDADAILSLG